MKPRRLLAFALGCIGLLGGCVSDVDGDRNEAATARPQGDGVPACDDVKGFAEVLTEVSVDHDYSPTESPAQLADTADTTLSGHLTGNVVLESDLAPNGFDEQWFVGYEVRVDRVAGSSSDVEPGALYTAFVFHGSHVEDAAHYSRAASAAAGAPAAVFALEGGERPTALIEGFVTSCERGPLLGWRGDRGQWPDLTTVDEVFDAVVNGAT